MRGAFAFGTFEACRRVLKTSAYWAGPEVGIWPYGALDPRATLLVQITGYFRDLGLAGQLPAML
jgi:hypothetical protein